MNAEQFWQMIDSVHVESGGDMDRKCELLKEQLLTLEGAELREFIAHFDSVDTAAYTWPLWGAAYVMNGGCSDDSFTDFRATLISQGRKIYERALSNPDSLVELDLDDGEDACYEGFQYVKNEVEEEKFGEISKRKINFPDEPTGTEWEEDALAQLYPKLSAKYFSGANKENERPPEGRPWWKFW